MIQAESKRIVGIAKMDRPAVVAREDDEAVATMPRLADVFQPQLLQDTNTGRMQPFARQTLGGVRMAIEQHHPRSARSERQRRHTAGRPCPNHHNV